MAGTAESLWGSCCGVIFTLFGVSRLRLRPGWVCAGAVIVSGLAVVAEGEKVGVVGDMVGVVLLGFRVHGVLGLVAFIEFIADRKKSLSPGDVADVACCRISVGRRFWGL